MFGFVSKKRILCIVKSSMFNKKFIITK
jgi:hypothetical protein